MSASVLFLTIMLGTTLREDWLSILWYYLMNTNPKGTCRLQLTAVLINSDYLILDFPATVMTRLRGAFYTVLSNAQGQATLLSI